MEPIEHKHLIVRAEVKTFFGKNQREGLREWMRDLIRGQDMNLLSGPHLAYVDRPGLVGWSGVAIIETSHVAIHVWEEHDPILVQFDFYTCGKLNVDVIRGAFWPFGASKFQTRVFNREYALVEVHS